jgi:predicted transcriptional regulator
MAETETKPICDPPLNAMEEARLDAEADAKIEAGKGIPHARVCAWLESWGTPNELPCPLPPE